MAKKKQVTKSSAELQILQLAALAIDVRRSLTPKELHRIPSLGGALTALDQVMKELGWRDEESKSD